MEGYGKYFWKKEGVSYNGLFKDNLIVEKTGSRNNSLSLNVRTQSPVSSFAPTPNRTLPANISQLNRPIRSQSPLSSVSSLRPPSIVPSPLPLQMHRPISGVERRSLQSHRSMGSFTLPSNQQPIQTFRRGPFWLLLLIDIHFYEIFSYYKDIHLC